MHTKDPACLLEFLAFNCSRSLLIFPQTEMQLHLMSAYQLLAVAPTSGVLGNLSSAQGLTGLLCHAGLCFRGHAHLLAAEELCWLRGSCRCRTSRARQLAISGCSTAAGSACWDIAHKACLAACCTKITSTVITKPLV